MIIVENSSKPHRFWEFTSKWYFFPLFYLTLAILFIIISKLIGRYLDVKDFVGIISLFLTVLYIMPSGLLFFLVLIGIKDRYLTVPALYFPILFHVFTVASIVVISYFKYKKHRILKWIIITLFLLFILSFIGCIIPGTPRGPF